MNPSLCCPDVRARCVEPADPWCRQAGAAQSDADSLEDRYRSSHNKTKSS